MDFKKIESKWQKVWENKKAFQAKKGKNKKYYVLEMYPYPSASGLHMGHAFNYTIGDILARFMRMKGFNVLYPMGYDSFGLPAENAAIKAKSHPKIFTDKAIANYVKQQKSLGLSYDWTRMLKSHDPEYYKWNQYFFLQFLKNGLAYRKKAPVNWCKKCQTVLANEQVHNGKCWRHPEVEVEIKQLEQWFLKTTKYAEELLDLIEKLEWPDRIKAMQKNWIGRSEGTKILFEIEKDNKSQGSWPIFTTRPDTIFGITFMVVSSQHLNLNELVTEKQKKQVEKFLRKIRTTKKEDLDKLDKEGVFTGSYATNPLTKEKVPIWVGNFVVADYGSGMVMAVPGHDQRDYDFAKKYNLPIKFVIKPVNYEPNLKDMDEAYTGEGILINSKQFNNLQSKEAIKKITNFLENKKLGKAQTQFKLKDWLVSRQRYWGTPIPVIYCEKCGIVSVPEKDLPVKLPEKVSFGKGNPLATNKSFVNVKCPKCGSRGRRETDTMDTFFDSSWYYLRYLDNKNKKQPFSKKIVKYWMPVNQYIGGAEHATMHLIYARFFTKALRDLNILGSKVDEPFQKLFNQGMLHGQDGMVMSKSRRNVVLPEKVSKKYGIDTARLFLVSMANPSKDIEWSEKGIDGSCKFITAVFDFFNKVKFSKNSSKKIQSKLNKTLKELEKEIPEFNYNLAVIKIRELFKTMLAEHGQNSQISKDDAGSFLKILSIFCPHVAEEFWSKIGKKSLISLEKWPDYDEKKIDEKLEQSEKIVDKTVSDVMNILKLVKNDIENVYIYVIPNEKEYYNEQELSKRVGKAVKIFLVNDKNKYDPKNFAKKSKPGKPGIFVE